MPTMHRSGSSLSLSLVIALPETFLYSERVFSRNLTFLCFLLTVKTSRNMPILMWWFPAVVEERETSTTTTTFPDGTTQSTTQTVRSRVPLTVDKEFVKSVPGVLKIVQMFLCFLAFLLSKIGWCFMTCGAYNFFGFVTMTSLLYELWTFLWYLTHGYMMISRVCWEKVVRPSKNNVSDYGPEKIRVQ
ncbi:uncharacterized protein LOC118404280 [Branchiostoma floridae]|uniref:Uncharacterized protein LOC118404280 n=1 Tax=Branchiostoma floridae TaxID=7739 RepID=A0A9J7KEM3_BRAFL|nr:uncharacterized protein LOC118404280 [Branchiostoma floridae]